MCGVHGKSSLSTGLVRDFASIASSDRDAISRIVDHEPSDTKEVVLGAVSHVLMSCHPSCLYYVTTFRAIDNTTRTPFDFL